MIYLTTFSASLNTSPLVFIALHATAMRYTTSMANLKHDYSHELASLMLQVLKDDKYAYNVAFHYSLYLHGYSWDVVAERMAKIIR